MLTGSCTSPNTTALSSCWFGLFLSLFDVSYMQDGDRIAILIVEFLSELLESVGLKLNIGLVQVMLLTTDARLS